MTQHMECLTEKFVILPERQQPALQSLKEVVATHQTIVNAEDDKEVFSTPYGKRIIEATSLPALLRDFGWIFKEETNRLLDLPEGSISGIHTGEDPIAYWHDHELFFAVLAPFVEPGYLEMRIEEDDTHWRWNFNGETCHSVLPTIIWPEYTDHY